MARSLYGTRTSLVLRRTDGALHVDGEPIDSVVGTKQGCTLGAFLFCVGLHFALLVTQALHPSAAVAAYMDDVHTQHADPVVAWAALCTFRTVAAATAASILTSPSWASTLATLTSPSSLPPSPGTPRTHSRA